MNDAIVGYFAGVLFRGFVAGFLCGATCVGVFSYFYFN
ncbi:hypothetical protein [Caudoviricetes sp.]|nr:hypothetical protein [Caudoviricetes sp.]